MMDRPSFWRADGDRKDLDCDGCGRMWDEHSADGSYCPIEPESEIEALRAENERLAKALAEAHERNRLIQDTQHINDFALAARVTELESRLAWHPVSEKPPQGESPKYSVGVEVVYDGVLQLRTLANYSFMDSSWRDDHDCRLDGVTHWREIGELPAAPNEAEPT